MHFIKGFNYNVAIDNFCYNHLGRDFSFLEHSFHLLPYTLYRQIANSKCQLEEKLFNAIWAQGPENKAKNISTTVRAMLYEKFYQLINFFF